LKIPKAPYFVEEICPPKVKPGTKTVSFELSVAQKTAKFAKTPEIGLTST